MSTDAAPALTTGNGKAPDVDVKALIRGSRRPERTVPLCLRGDLVAVHEGLERDLAEVIVGPQDDRLTGANVKAKRIGAQIEKLEKQMRDSTLVLRLRALSPSRWAELTAEHPPRKADDGTVNDRDVIGVNSSTFFDALIRESVVEPVLDDEDWDLLLGEGEHGLTEGQHDTLSGAAWTLNKRDVDVPFSRAASRLSRKPVSE